MSVKRLEITLSEEVWGLLDERRGFEPRASFVKRALEQALGCAGSSPGPAPARASEEPALKREEAVAAIRPRPAPGACPECGRFNGVHKGSCSQHPRNLR